MPGAFQLNYHHRGRRRYRRWIAIVILVSALATGVECRVPIRHATAVFLCRYFPWDGPWVRLAPALDGQDEGSVLSEDEEFFASRFSIRYAPLLEKAHHDRQAAMQYLEFSTRLGDGGAAGECYVDDCRDLLDSWPEQDVSDFLDQLDASTRREVAYILQARYAEVDMPEDGAKWRAFAAARPTLATRVLDLLKKPAP